ncbi:MAG: terpene cyclase/mutase family protein [Deltaproteobacteria bacterium]|nr:terpene cyclase/mutase family protein [Deltaproteobacteria bacterium]
MEPLRRRAATALERGLTFVEAHGNPFSRLRVQVLLEAVPPDRGIDALSARQNRDGSFVRLGQVLPGALEADLAAAGVPDPLLGTFEALRILSDQRGLHAAAAEKAVDFLASVQQEDGSWGPEPGDRAAEEGVEGVRLFVTGCLTGLLGGTRFARPQLLESAGRYLAAEWKPERIVTGGWADLAAFASYFANVPSDASEAALEWCGRELERGFRAGHFDARETLRVLRSCNVMALPGASLGIQELLSTLLGEQDEDGGFAAEEPTGSAGRVGPTLDAMLGLLALCRHGSGA